MTCGGLPFKRAFLKVDTLFNACAVRSCRRCSDAERTSERNQSSVSLLPPLRLFKWRAWWTLCELVIWKVFFYTSSCQQSDIWTFDTLQPPEMDLCTCWLDHFLSVSHCDLTVLFTVELLSYREVWVRVWVQKQSSQSFLSAATSQTVWLAENHFKLSHLVHIRILCFVLGIQTNKIRFIHCVKPHW